MIRHVFADEFIDVDPKDVKIEAVTQLKAYQDKPKDIQRLAQQDWNAGRLKIGCQGEGEPLVVWASETGVIRCSKEGKIRWSRSPSLARLPIRQSRLGRTATGQLTNLGVWK